MKVKDIDGIAKMICPEEGGQVIVVVQATKRTQIQRIFDSEAAALAEIHRLKSWGMGAWD